MVHITHLTRALERSIEELHSGDNYKMLRSEEESKLFMAAFEKLLELVNKFNSKSPQIKGE